MQIAISYVSEAQNYPLRVLSDLVNHAIPLFNIEGDVIGEHFAVLSSSDADVFSDFPNLMKLFVAVGHFGIIETMQLL